jgi:imidazolonepropionase-like amidohydrolase
MAIEAGVDTFEHGRFLTDAQLERMATLGRFLVPTLSPEARHFQFDYRSENSPENPNANRWMEIANEVMYDTVDRAHRQGVRVAAGSDVAMPHVRHGEVAYEMYHLSKAGLTNQETIATGTRVAAETLNLGASIGQVRPGFIADLILVAGDPLRDLEILQHEASIRMVIQGGRVAIDRGLGQEARELSVTVA